VAAGEEDETKVLRLLQRLVPSYRLLSDVPPPSKDGRSDDVAVEQG
jgi:hypothetical protein